MNFSQINLAPFKKFIKIYVDKIAKIHFRNLITQILFMISKKMEYKPIVSIPSLIYSFIFSSPLKFSISISLSSLSQIRKSASL